MSIPTFELEQKLPGAFHLPTRMSVLPLAERKLALVSPIPVDDALAAKLEALGEVSLLIAPNLLHSSYLRAASERYPRARVLAPAALCDKRPTLRIDGQLGDSLPRELTDAVDVLHVDGAPKLDEYVFFHRESRALVVTDLLFHVERPRGPVAHLVLFLAGTHGKLATSRALRMMIEDRAAAARSLEQVLALPVESLVMAHGSIVTRDARARLAEALRWSSASLPRSLMSAT